MCSHAMKPARVEGPFQVRRGLATMRLVTVDQIGDTLLSCDCLHDGEHEWPDAYQRITSPEMPDAVSAPSADGVDEGEVGV